MTIFYKLFSHTIISQFAFEAQTVLHALCNCVRLIFDSITRKHWCRSSNISKFLVLSNGLKVGLVKYASARHEQLSHLKYHVRVHRYSIRLMNRQISRHHFFLTHSECHSSRAIDFLKTSLCAHFYYVCGKTNPSVCFNTRRFWFSIMAESREKVSFFGSSYFFNWFSPATLNAPSGRHLGEISLRCL